MTTNRGLVHELRKNGVLFLMLLPAATLVIMLCYIPMTGIILAFKDYKYNLGIFGSPWAGFNNFRYFFISGTGLRVTQNTIMYNLLNLFTSQALAIMVAIVLCEMKNIWFRKLSQSFIFLPYFISWIIVGVFVLNIFGYESGVLNSVLKSLGFSPVDIYGMPSAWRYIIVFFNAWKWVGYISVVYIAAITNISPECFESADLDGANVFQKIFYITIPSITPTISIMFLLNIGKLLRGDFQMFYQIVGDNGQLFNATDVIDTFVFRSLINSGDMAMSAAATFYQSVLCFAIILLANGAVRKISPENSLF